MRRAGVALVAAAVFGALFAPVLAPHDADERRPALFDSPPTLLRVFGADGRPHAPFIYRWTLASRLEQRYELDRTTVVPLVWMHGGRLVQSSDEARAPVFLLGGDSFGRDVFARLLYGARTSLALSLVAALGATLIGAVLGGLAGYTGGAVDEALMRASDFVLVLPAMYVALGLRSVLPLVLAPATVFGLLAAIFAVLGAPFAARGVRAIVRTESRLDYALAARSLGAGHWRMLAVHLIPAAGGFMAMQATLFVPAFIVAEATLSYVGLGFPEPVVSWGTMLHDASNIRALADFPWLLSPAAAIFLLVFGLNLTLQRRGGATIPRI